MNVLLLTQFLSTTKGGGEHTFSLIAKKIAESGNKVWIIVNRVKGDEPIKTKNMKIIFVPPELEYEGGQPQSFSGNLSYSWNSILKGISLVKKENIDIIHSNNFAPAFAGSVISLITGKPHITTIHHISSLYQDFWKKWGCQENISKTSVILGPFFEKLITKFRCDAILTVTEKSKEDLMTFGTKKPIYVIPNVLENIKYNESRKNSFEFIYIGRLLFYKNLEVVIKAMDILKKSNQNFKLNIVGDGPHKKVLQKLVNDLRLEENIFFKGHVTELQKKELLLNSQVLLFPSLLEGFGIVILEAFSAAIPVVVSKVRPMSDIVEDKITGFVVPAHDEKRWAEVMKKMIESPTEIIQMGKKGRHVLEKKYNPLILKEKILEMYSEQIQSSELQHNKLPRNN